MSRWLMTKFAALAMALASPAKAGEGDRTPLVKFPTEQAARDYLKDNPTGELARLAFLALVEFRLMKEYPGMSPEQAMKVFSRKPARKPEKREVPVAIY